MSQVKKLQTGGKFRMNGREISGQTAIDRLAAVYSGLPLNEREMFTVAQSAIQNGDIAEYNPTNNTIRVTNVNGDDVTSNYTNTRASVNNSEFKKTLGAIFNDEAHRFKKSGEAMALVDMTDPNEIRQSSTAKTVEPETPASPIINQENLTTTSTSVIPADWKGSRDAAIGAGVGFEFKDGHWYITGDNDYNKYNWYTGGLDFLKGTEFENGFILNNGRLVTADEALTTQDAKLKKILTPWMEANNPIYNTWNQRYDIFANSGIRFVGDRTGQATDYYGVFGNT